MPNHYTDEFWDKLTLGEMQRFHKSDPEFYNSFAEYHRRKSPGTPNFLELFATLVMSFGIVASKGKSTFGFSEEAIDAAKILDLERSLLRAGWLVSPYLLKNTNNNNFIHKPISLLNEPHLTNELMCKIFYSDNMFHLGRMIKTWEKNPLFMKRMKLMMDSFELCKLCIKKSSKVTISSFLIPVLIAQIDGIKNDFLFNNGYQFRNGSLFHKNKNIKDWELINMIFNKNKDEGDTYYFAVLVGEILFGKAYPKEPFSISMEKETTKYVYDKEIESVFLNLNRHKIMHGEDIDYGNKQNLLRIYLILDFMNEIME